MNQTTVRAARTLRAIRHRRAARHVVLLWAIVAGGWSCADGSSSVDPTVASAEATAHVNQVLDVMQANSVRRLTVNWPALRDTVLAAAMSAQTIPQTYPAILEALRMLHDGHSSYRIPGGGTLTVPTHTCVPTGAPVASVPLNIGYVRVGSFAGTGTAATSFADSLQQVIRIQDRPDLVGWIVDLRGNGGGNMWPMIAGLGPILGDTLLGHFVYPTGAIEPWRYRNGAAILNGVEIVRVANPHRLLHENPRVAVVTDNGVASSGEATVVAFKSRPDTRSFGASTCGLTTGNQGFTLSNGAVLVVSTSLMADRALNQFGDAIAPDETTVNTSDAVARAIAWLVFR